MMRRKETGGRSQENTNTGGRRQELGARRIQIQESGDRSKESGEYKLRVEQPMRLFWSTALGRVVLFCGDG